MIKKFTTLPSPKRVHKDKDKYYTANAYITSSLQYRIISLLFTE